MAQTIQIKLPHKACQAGLLYAQKHLTTPPKDAVISCEGICRKERDRSACGESDRPPLGTG